ncbi:MFS transporter, partial [Corynebacterium heidelbergense]
MASPRTKRYPGLAAAAPLLAVSTLRTAAFMGQLAFVASLYHERFGLGPEVFAWVWSLSGLSFFLGNFGGGKVIKGVRAPQRIAGLLTVAAMASALAIVGLCYAPTLPLALIATSAVAVTHAVIAACVTTLLV